MAAHLESDVERVTFMHRPWQVGNSGARLARTAALLLPRRLARRAKPEAELVHGLFMAYIAAMVNRKRRRVSIQSRYGPHSFETHLIWDIGSTAGSLPTGIRHTGPS